jgi:hypothetical protein
VGVTNRAVVAVVTLVVTIAAASAPAAADPPEPTNTRSTAFALQPDVTGVRAEMVGADSFLEVRVARGRTVVVLGYENEPYLRFLPDGTVEENRNSPATYLNQDRFASSAVPPTATAAAPANWRPVASGGQHAWHDHRTHYMGRGDPPAPVDWQVALVVDGEPVAVVGRYEPVAAPSPVAWWLLAVGVAVVLGLLAVRRPWTAAAAAAAAGVLVVVVGAALVGQPASGPPGWTAVGLGAVGAVGGVLALVWRGRPAAGALLAGSGLALVLAGIRRLAVLDHAVLPTDLPAWVERASVALALGAGVTAAAVGAWALVGPIGASSPRPVPG